MLRNCLGLLLLLSLSACIPSPADVSYPCDTGSITLEELPGSKRIISASVGAGAVVAALGASNQLLATDLGSDVGIEVINPGHQINVERLVALQPTLIFIDSHEPDETALEAISRLGAKTVLLEPVHSFEDSLKRNLEIAAALDVTERGERLNQLIRAELSELGKGELSGKRIAFLYLRGSTGTYLLGGDGAGSDDVIEAVAATDVGTEIGVRGFAPVNPEGLFGANPDYFLVMDKGLESIGGIDAFYNLPGVANTAAALSKNILVADDARLLSFDAGYPRLLACLSEQAEK